jgi:aldehyde dehydrogenase (NAD+)
METFKNLIDGELVGASDGGTYETRDPAHPGEVLGSFPLATAADAARAVAAAAAAQPAWAATPAPARGAILYKASELVDVRVDQLARAMTREEGKTLAESRGEVLRARDILRYYGGEGWRVGGDVLPANAANGMLYTRREPLGVVAVITPWNFPLAIPAWKIAPALVYGNAVVFKPASATPHSAVLLVEALVEAGLPAGVLNLLIGPGAAVGDTLADAPEVRGVSFTGSYAVGSALYSRATARMARAQVEMGGKNPLVVLADADLDLAVRLAVMGGFGLTGQACTATSRVIVEEAVADAFVVALAEAVRGLKVGDGLDDGVQMGPAISAEQLETDLRYIEVGKAEGAALVVGGERLDGEGHFVQPTVFDRVTTTMRIAQEEIFGPVVGVIRVAGFDEAVAAANAIEFGLSASVVTRDLGAALTFAERVEAGVVKVNEPTTGLALQAPFGGFRHSSATTFKEQGAAALEFYTRTKTVYVTYG